MNLVSDPIEAQEIPTPSGIALSDEVPAGIEDAFSSRAGAWTPLGISSPQPLQAANDNALGVVAVRRTYQRRKPRKSDLRCRTTLASIHPVDYDQARIAFNRSWGIGLGLDAAVTLRPAVFQTMTFEERDREVRRFLKRIRSFYADNDDMPPLAYLLTREAEYGDVEGCSEHVHLLIHTGTGKVKRKLRRYLLQRYTEIEVKVATASPDRVRLRGGEIGDASTYSLKAVDAAYAKKHELPHRFSGPVYGARVFWSKNLNPARPRIRVPRPKAKGQIGRPSEAQPKAA